MRNARQSRAIAHEGVSETTHRQARIQHHAQAAQSARIESSIPETVAGTGLRETGHDCLGGDEPHTRGAARQVRDYSAFPGVAKNLVRIRVTHLLLSWSVPHMLISLYMLPPQFPKMQSRVCAEKTQMYTVSRPRDLQQSRLSADPSSDPPERKRNASFPPSELHPSPLL